MRHGAGSHSMRSTVRTCGLCLMGAREGAVLSCSTSASRSALLSRGLASARGATPAGSTSRPAAHHSCAEHRIVCIRWVLCDGIAQPYTKLSNQACAAGSTQQHLDTACSQLHQHALYHHTALPHISTLAPTPATA